jgi:hypothetical protein
LDENWLVEVNYLCDGWMCMQGLEPVVSSSVAIRSSWHNGNTNYMDTSDHQELGCDSGEGDHDLQLPKPCRDVASAPFWWSFCMYVCM